MTFSTDRPGSGASGADPVGRAELRTRLRRERRAIDAAVATASAAAAAGIAGDLPWWHAARHVATYVAAGGELDPQPLAERACREGKGAFVPVLHDSELRFASDDADADADWVPNRFGIAEPSGPRLEPAEMDLVIVPAVALDTDGRRLGQGGGFYDRTFAWLSGEPRPSSVVLVGFVYDFQVVDTIEDEPWDVTLDAIVTPTRWWACG